MTTRICANCKRPRSIHARQCCGACYKKLLSFGMLGAHPRRQDVPAPQNHCIDCGKKVSRGRTHHTDADAVTCLVCQTAHALSDWTYRARRQAQEARDERH